jgi:LysR family hydrogen peroxide-inducible transcriptional activator
MNISLVQLEYLLALNTCGSFVAAADHCHVTQPTLSMQLKKLEEELGVLIFDRSKQPLMPTYVGTKIIEQAKVALQEVRMINEIVNESKGVIKGELQIGIVPTLSPYLLPLFIGSFTRKYPGVQITIHDLQTEEILSKIKQDQIDVGILITPTHDGSIIEKPVFYEEFYAYLNQELAEDQKGNSIEIEQLLQNRLWVLEEGNCFRNQTFNLCRLNQLNYKNQHFKYESGNLQTIIKMVDHEGGATLIPQLAANDLPEDRRERLRFIGKNHPVREVSLVHSRKFAKIMLINKLEEKIRLNLPQEILNNKTENIVEIYTQTGIVQ